jgi:ketosteroid isomerase-like protein
VTVTSRHGKLPVQRTGHTLSILRKGGDGQWRLTRDANMLASPA